MIDYNATLSQVVHDYVINVIFLFRKNLSSSTAGGNIKIVARIAVNSINCHLLLPSLLITKDDNTRKWIKLHRLRIFLQDVTQMTLTLFTLV